MSKTNTGLVEYAKAQVGKPYWYGTFGRLGTKDHYNEKKAAYPSQYQWAYDPKEATQKVHDCTGLVEGYLFFDSPNGTVYKYNGNQDRSANGTRSACKESGPISTMPELPGVIVFKDGHMGVYIGNGEVIDARGRAWGVVRGKLKDVAWTHWGKHPDITYEEPKPVTPAPSTPDGDLIKAVKAFFEAVDNMNEKYKTLTGLLED